MLQLLNSAAGAIVNLAAEQSVDDSPPDVTVRRVTLQPNNTYIVLDAAASL